jgi:hypothetical protein
VSYSHPDMEGHYEETAAREDERCTELQAEVEALIKGPVHLEEHDEVPGEWGVWCGEEPNAELMGSGMSRRAALEDALEQAKDWAWADEDTGPS